MTCKNCGNEIAPGSLFCTVCGVPVDTAQAEVQQPAQPAPEAPASGPQTAYQQVPPQGPQPGYQGAPYGAPAPGYSIKPKRGAFDFKGGPIFECPAVLFVLQALSFVVPPVLLVVALMLRTAEEGKHRDLADRMIKWATIGSMVLAVLFVISGIGGIFGFLRSAWYFY